MGKKVEIHWLLDLPRNASPEEVEQRCETLLDWLESDSIPEDLRSWASRQAGLIQEIHAGAGPAVAPDAPGPPDMPGFMEEGPEEALPVQGGRTGSGKDRRRFFFRLEGRPLFSASLGAVLGLAIMGGLWWGGVIFDGGEDAPHAAGVADINPGQPNDSRQARIEELEAVVEASPGDTAALFELGETHITIEDWAGAIFWFEKLLELEPSNFHAQLDTGTANMNLGRDQEAEAAFLRALDMDPESPQVHYNLGFLFAFRGDAPDLDVATGHWQEVIRLAPESDLAGVARVHIDQFQSLQSEPEVEK